MKVDPFVVPIPRSLLQNSDPQIGQYFRYLNRFLHDLWQRTGGGDDFIETTINQSITQGDNNPAATAEILQRLDALQESQLFNVPVVREYNPVSVSIDYSASPFDFVNAKKRCRITLPEYGSVIIRNGDGTPIEITAGSKLINGENLAVIRRETTTLFLQYFIDEDEWFAR